MPNKLDILVELERRGELPENKVAILNELRRRGEIPVIQPVSRETQQPKLTSITPSLLGMPFNLPVPAALEPMARKIESVQRPIIKGITGGLSSQVSDLAKYFGGLLTGGEKTLGNIREERRSFERRLEQEHPLGKTGATFSELAASALPISKITGAISKIPIIAKGLSSGNLGANLLAALGRGVSTTGAFTAADPDLKLTPGAMAVGSTIDPAVMAAGKAAPYVAKSVKFGMKMLPAGVGERIERAGEIFSKWKTGRLEKQAEKFAEKEGVQDIQIAGRKSQEGIKTIFDKASEKYLQLKSSMLKKFGGNRVSAETLRKGMVEELKGITELAGDLDPADAALKKVLEKWQERLIANPTLHELDDLATTLYKASKKPNSNPAYKRLYESARENLLDAMDEAVVTTGQRNRAFTTAEKEAEKLKKAQASLTEEAAQPLKGTRQLEEIGQARESLSKEQQQIDDMIENLTSENELIGAQARETYRTAREDIAKHLKLKKSSIGKLAKSEYPEQVIESAKGKGKLDMASAVENAISTNPSFKVPLRTTVLADIMRYAGDQKTFAKALKSYEQTLSKLLDPAELAELNRLAGIRSPAPGLMQSFLKKIGSKAGVGATTVGIKTVKAIQNQ